MKAVDFHKKAGLKPSLEKGLVQVYTGEGKGKTTAAVGLAIRAAGAGLKVGFFQFFKKPISGELEIIRNIKNIDVYTLATLHPAFQYMSAEELRRYRDNFKKIWTRDVMVTMKRKHYDIVILDEILIAIRDGFIDEKDLLSLINGRNEKTEVVLTGRYITDRITEKADIITEMKKVKHPFPEVKARRRDRLLKI